MQKEEGCKYLEKVEDLATITNYITRPYSCEGYKKMNNIGREQFKKETNYLYSKYVNSCLFMNKELEIWVEDFDLKELDSIRVIDRSHTRDYKIVTFQKVCKELN